MVARILKRGLQGHLYVKHKLLVLLSIINSVLLNSVCLGTSFMDTDTAVDINVSPQSYKVSIYK